MDNIKVVKSDEEKLYHIIVPFSGNATLEVMAKNTEELYKKLDEDEVLQSAIYDIPHLDIESAIVLIKPNKIKN